MNCVFCDRVWSKDEFKDVERVLDEAPMSELGGLRAVLGGGEPTLHPKLPQILEGLAGRGVRKLSMRTNGAWAAREGPVRFLVKKGLREVALLFPTDDAADFDRLTRKTGAWQAVQAGIANLAANKVRVTARVPVLRPTLSRLQDIVQALPALIPTLVRVDLVLLDSEHTPDFDALNAAMPFGSDHPWPEVPELFLDPGPGIPLCLSHAMEHWRLSPDVPSAPGHKPEACQRCFVRNACSGQLRCMSLPLKPVPLDFDDGVDRPKRRSQDGLPFEPVKGVTYECGEGEATLASVRLRVGHACNRRCEFCFIPHHEKAGHDHDIPASIQAAVEAGARELVMTGGEPTLVKELPDYIDQASRGGVRRIVLQTNAMRLANEDFTRRLVDSGLTSTVISLHSHRDEVLEQITTLPNTMDRILRGIRNLHEAGVQASITHVIGPKNFRHMPDFARFMIEEAGLRRFCFIFATPMAWPMARKEILPRYSDAAPYVMEAMDIAIDHDVIVDGLAFKCGAPHCVVGGDPKYLLDAVPIPEENRTPDWIRIPACETCTLKHQCYGVRRLYAWVYGIDEFKPVLEEGKRAEDWNRGRFLPRRETSMTDPVEALFARVEALGLQLPELTVQQGAEGFRVRAGDLTMGPLARTGNLEEARRMALAATLQQRAIGVEVDGAHGVVTGDLAAYLDGLDGPDHLLPHTSIRWAEVLEQPDRDEVRILRRRSGPRMTSVHSAIATASAALLEVGGDRLIRYGIHGYGRAGRHFAKHFDRVVLEGERRPSLVACADSKSSVIDARGLEFERLAAFKVRHDRLPRPVQERTEPDAVLGADLDLLLLAGRTCPEAVLNTPAGVVVDLTGTLTPALEARLWERGVVVVPALLATCGPILLADAERLGLDDAPQELIARRSVEAYAAARALGGPLTDALLRRALQRDSGKSESSGAASKGLSPRSP